MSETSNKEDYVFTKKLNLNLDEIYFSSFQMNQYILNTLSYENKDSRNINKSWPLTTQYYKNYNILMYPLPGIHNLYEEIRTMFHEVNTEKGYNFFIQCWLNVYYAGQFIDWHSHWPIEMKSMHGFFCLDTEGSYTSYKLKNGKQFDVQSENNLLVIGKSGEDLHKSSEWPDKEKPRITIAFDIVPDSFIYQNKLLPVNVNPNHWVPI